MTLSTAQKSKIASYTNLAIMLIVMLAAALVIKLSAGYIVPMLPDEIFPRVLAGLAAIVCWCYMVLYGITYTCGSLSDRWKAWGAE
jgi:hypothetical protein